MPTIHKLASTITAHAWNADRTKVAICPNSSEVWIYGNADKSDTTAWVKEATLAEHDLVVTSIDWCAVSNRIVTCSQDRNAFVWTFDTSSGEWTHQLAVLRITRAATHCKWSPDGSKFAVASGSKVVAICGLEASNDWWFAAQIGRFKSTVNAVAWHPNSKLIAAAGCDFHCRIAAAWLSDVGDSPDAGPFGSGSDFNFGDFVLDLSLDADPVPSTWINDAAWSPSGMQLAYVTQGSDLLVLDMHSASAITKQVVRHRGLPFLRCCFLDDDTIVAVGFDMNPARFKRGASGWAFDAFVDANTSADAGAAGKGGAAAASGGGKSSFSAARALFAAKVDTGRTASAAAADKLRTKHEGTIVGVCPLGSAAGGGGGTSSSSSSTSTSSSFSTIGTDGRLILWS